MKREKSQKWSGRISVSARHDLAQALNWTLENFGSRQHKKYLSLIKQSLQDIGNDPDGLKSKARPKLYPDARTLHIARKGKMARHFFVYRITADGNIEVARFLHDAMELVQHLPKGFGAQETEQDQPHA